MTDHSLINLQEYRTPKASSICAQLETYWESLRVAYSIPQRSQIDPRGIEAALRHTFVLETIALGHAKIRVAGLGLNHLMGMEVRGMPMSCVIEPAFRETFARVLRRVVSEPAKLRLSLQSRFSRRQSKNCGEMILLPLKDSQGHITRLLGALDTDLGATKTPVRFTPTEAKLTTLEYASPARDRATMATKALMPKSARHAAQNPRGNFLTLVYSKD